MDVCELGFVEKAEDPSHLTSSFFPSKLGGKPAWLDPLNTPSPGELSCGHCMKPLTFLLQVYAPFSDRNNDCAFHRTIFVFMCSDPNCHQYKNKHAKCFKALRCQLPEVNDFYDKSVNGDNVEAEATVTEELERLKLNQSKTNDCNSYDSLVSSACGVSPCCDYPSEVVPAAPVCDTVYSKLTSDAEVVKCKPASSIASPQTLSSGNNLPSLCVVCGIQGPKRCGKCQIVNYCCRDHQIHDWKNGHKLFCSDLASGQRSLSDIGYDPSLGVALPLLEIVTELEPDLSSLEKQPERNDEERMADYHKYVRSRNINVSKEDTKKSKHDETSDKRIDKLFKVFKKRVALEPEQVCLITVDKFSLQ